VNVSTYHRFNATADHNAAGSDHLSSVTPQPNLNMNTEKFLKSANRSRAVSGFTLVEMLLVLVILATLAAIVYPKVMGRSEQARVTAAQTQIANFKTALDAFEVDTGYYPKGRNGLNDLIQQPRDVTGWHGPYLESIPKDPWGGDYLYECPGKHNPNSYDISSPGAPGGQSPIGNWQSNKQ
jgi:general secretion pathway protein G